MILCYTLKITLAATFPGVTTPLGVGNGGSKYSEGQHGVVLIEPDPAAADVSQACLPFAQCAAANGGCPSESLCKETNSGRVCACKAGYQDRYGMVGIGFDGFEFDATTAMRFSIPILGLQSTGLANIVRPLGVPPATDAAQTRRDTGMSVSALAMPSCSGSCTGFNRLVIPWTPVMNQTVMYVTMWVKRLQQDPTHVLLESQGRWRLAMDNPVNTLRFTELGTETQDVVTPEEVPLNTWALATLAIDGATVTVGYHTIPGSSASAILPALPRGSAGDLLVHGTDSSLGAPNVVIDDVAIFDTIPSVAQAATLATAPDMFCLDVNECASGNGGCGPHSVCVNKPGGFECACGRGYVQPIPPGSAVFIGDGSFTPSNPSVCHRVTLVGGGGGGGGGVSQGGNGGQVRISEQSLGSNAGVSIPVTVGHSGRGGDSIFRMDTLAPQMQSSNHTIGGDGSATVFGPFDVDGAMIQLTALGGSGGNAAMQHGGSGGGAPGCADGIVGQIGGVGGNLAPISDSACPGGLNTTLFSSWASVRDAALAVAQEGDGGKCSDFANGGGGGGGLLVGPGPQSVLLSQFGATHTHLPHPRAHRGDHSLCSATGGSGFGGGGGAGGMNLDDGTVFSGGSGADGVVLVEWPCMLCQLLLDINVANAPLSLSEGQRSATMSLAVYGGPTPPSTNVDITVSISSPNVVLFNHSNVISFSSGMMSAPLVLEMAPHFAVEKSVTLSFAASGVSSLVTKPIDDLVIPLRYHNTTLFTSVLEPNATKPHWQPDVSRTSLASLGVTAGVGARFGAAIENIGRVDDDNFDDVLVTAPGSNSDGNGRGTAFVLFGGYHPLGANATRIKLDAASGSLNGTVADGAMFGSAATYIAKRLIAVAGFASPTHLRVWLLGLNTDGTVATVDYVDVEGATGVALASTDIDADGVGEVIVGVPYSAKVVVLKLLQTQTVGKFDTSVLVQYGQNSLGFSGEQAGPSLPSTSLFGHAVAVIGDVDRSGAIDIVVGDPGDGAYSGAMYVLGLSALLDGNVTRWTKIDKHTASSIWDAALVGRNSTSTMAMIGASLSGVGDISNDGHADMLVGTVGLESELGHLFRYYEVTDSPYIDALFDIHTACYFFPRTVASATTFNRITNMLYTPGGGSNVWMFGNATGEHPASPPASLQPVAGQSTTRLLFLPDTRLYFATTSPITSAATAADCYIGGVERDGSLVDAQLAVFHGGWGGSCFAFTNGPSHIYCQSDASTILKFATTVRSTTLKLVQTITLTYAAYYGARPGGLFAFDGYWFLLTQSASQGSRLITAYNEQGVYQGSSSAKGTGGLHSVYFDWWFGRYWIVDGFADRRQGDLYPWAGQSGYTSAESHCVSPPSIYHTLRPSPLLSSPMSVNLRPHPSRHGVVVQDAKLLPHVQSSGTSSTGAALALLSIGGDSNGVLGAVLGAPIDAANDIEDQGSVYTAI